MRYSPRARSRSRGRGVRGESDCLDSLEVSALSALAQFEESLTLYFEVLSHSTLHSLWIPAVGLWIVQLQRTVRLEMEMPYNTFNYSVISQLHRAS